MTQEDGCGIPFQIELPVILKNSTLALALQIYFVHIHQESAKDVFHVDPINLLDYVFLIRISVVHGREKDPPSH
jgi:hypothetical protein